MAGDEQDVPRSDDFESRWVPASVSRQSDVAQAQLVESVEIAHCDHAAHQRLAKVLGIQRPVLRIDSQAKYGLVASGRADLYLRLPAPGAPEYREYIWDHAAGSLLVEEAGGRVSDVQGASLDFGQGRRLSKNRGVVVSNGCLHDVVLNALRNGEVP